jgi:uncharacterized protein YmfQ (DUF2313 family)
MAVTLKSWVSSLQALLPPGRAFSREPDSVLSKLLGAIAAMYLAADLQFEQLLQQADPRQATSMLPDWERLLGLPDACLPLDNLSTAERQRIAYQRLTEQGGQSRAYFIELADLYGEPGTTITEFSQFTCESACVDALYSQADQFVWRLNIPRAAENVQPFDANRACTSSLLDYDASIAECPIRERKPAHTTVLFAYTNS